MLKRLSRSKFALPFHHKILGIPGYRLRQVDVKAEHFERQVQRVEQERDHWEKKYEVSSVSSPIAPVRSNDLPGSGREIPKVQEGVG